MWLRSNAGTNGVLGSLGYATIVNGDEKLDESYRWYKREASSNCHP